MRDGFAKCGQCGIMSEWIYDHGECDECGWVDPAASAKQADDGTEIRGRDSGSNPRVIRVKCHKGSTYVLVSIGPANSKNSRASIRLLEGGINELIKELNEAKKHVFSA